MSFGDSRNTGFGGSSGGGDGFGQGGRRRRDDDRQDQLRGYEEKGDRGMRSAQPWDINNRFSGRGDNRDEGGYGSRGRNENNEGSYERNGPRGNFDENRREGQGRPNFDDRNGFGGGRNNEVNRAGGFNDGNSRGGDDRGSRGGYGGFRGGGDDHGGNGFGNHNFRSGDDRGNRGGLGGRSQGGSNFGDNGHRDFQTNRQESGFGDNRQRSDGYGRGDNEPRREERSQSSNNSGFGSRPGLGSQGGERRPEAERPRFNENSDNMRSGNDGRRSEMVFTNSASRHRDNNDRRDHSSADYGGPRSNFSNVEDAGGSSRNYDRNDGNNYRYGNNRNEEDSRGGDRNYGNSRGIEENRGNSRGDGFGNDSGGSIFKPHPFIRNNDGMGNFRGGGNSGFGNRPSYNFGVDNNRANYGRRVNEGTFNRSRSNFDGENNHASNYGQRDGNRFGGNGNNMGRMTYERNQGGFEGSNHNGGNFGGRRGYSSNYGGGEDENSGLKSFSERTFYSNHEGPVKERAPKDWLPTEFSVEDLYIEDNSQENTYTEADLDEVEVEGASDQRFNSWANSGLDEKLIDILVNKRNFPTPRPIQSATIPQVLQGKDVITKAETGSGKTLAFVLPIIDSILKGPRDKRERNSPLAVILEPTRELADQVYRDFQRMTAGTGINVVLNYGEIPKRNILPRLNNVDIYVGTVGRFKDYLQNDLIILHQLKFFVLDEADQMLKREKMDDLDQVFNSELFFCSDSSRQTMLYSATMNSDALEMASKLMRKDKIVKISTNGSRANKHIKQVYVLIRETCEKTKYLENMFEKDMEEGKTVKTLIFVATRKQSDVLAMHLGNILSISAESINGDRPQHLRSEAMNKFRSGKMNILVGTDVASRGHDIPQLDRVVLYDIPSSASDVEEGLNNLAHRIGRTGRARQGTAIMLIDSSVTPSLAQGLVQMAKEVNQEPPEFLKALANGKIIDVSSFEEKKEEKEVTSGGTVRFGFGRGASTGFGVKKEETPATSLNKKEEEEATPGGSSSAFGRVGFGGSPSTSDEKEEEDQPTASSFGTVGFGEGSTSEKKKEKEEVQSGFGTGFHRRKEETTSSSSSNSDEEEDEDNTEEKTTKKEKKPAEKARSSSPDY